MLYDKRWDREIKADPFSLEGLIAWLEKQPACDEYCYLDNGGCLLHQYFAASGVDAPWVGGTGFKDSSGDWKPLSEEFRLISRAHPRTYGGALARARAELAQ